ncbi:platelet glycoprotein IX [Lampetra fluviatilis]
MLALALWCAFALLHGAAACPAGCICYRDSTVNCSRKGLTDFPRDVPSNTKRLLLQGNQLQTVPPGALDHLHRLMKLTLEDNPWHCDCSIRYLVLWLHDAAQLERVNATCGKPKFLMRTLISTLSGLELGTECARPHSISCWEVAQRDIGLHIIYATLLLPLGYCYLWYRGGGEDGARARAASTLRRSQRASRLAAITAEDIYEDIDGRIMATGVL